VAAMGLIWMVEHWQALSSRSSPIILALDIMPTPPAPMKPVAEVPAWAQAVAAVRPELRAPPVAPAPIPDVSPVAVSDPVVVPVLDPPDRPVVPDLAREDLRALAALPLWTPTQASAVSNSAQPSRITGPGDGGGHPMALAEIRPYYPYSARTRGEEGKVMIRLRVTSEGVVDSAAIGRSSGSSVLDESALAAARKARFKPAEHNGRPVAADMDLQFDFRLQD